MIRRIKISNPCEESWRKPTDQVTDRALRYRSNACPPPGERRCAFCGAKRTVEVGHVNGHEEDLAPQNLIWTCRSCNVLCGNALRAVGLGRKTKQFNPQSEGAKSLGQWIVAVSAMKGQNDAMSVADAVEMVRATPADRRSRFASEIWRRRRARGTDKQVPF